ncbi:MAG: DUF1015 domain-containing protein [Planctomycetota bacterium]
MPDARAFRALRFTAKAGAIESLVAPPYDVMSSEARAKLAAKSPHNIVHLTLPQGEAEGEPFEARYERAAGLLKHWLDSGAVEVEAEPSVTVVQEVFSADGTRRERTGVEVAVRLTAYGEGEIYPHETTLEPPKVDRLALMRSTRTQLGPTFLLVPDEDGELRAAIGDMCSREPDASVDGPDEAKRRVWYERDEGKLRRIEQALAGRPAVIADGHHRYETALNYRDGLGASDNDPAAFVLCHLVPVGDPGLVVLPTHRVVQPASPVEPAALLAKLEANFEVKEITREAAIDFERRAPAEGEAQGFVIALGRPPEFRMLTLREAGAMAERSPDRAEAWRALDVPCLHLLVIEDILGISPGEVASGRRISYSHDAATVVTAVEHEGGLGFILRPTTPEAVSRVARAGEKMPQKSTYFYPKVAAGFAMRLMR